MDWTKINRIAKERFKGACRVCRVCDGVACAGDMPGIGGIGTGSSFKANFEALSSYKFVLRTFHDAREPNTRLGLFGRTLQTPILAAPVMGTQINLGGALPELELAQSLVAGSAQAGSVGLTGDGPAQFNLFEIGLQAISEQNGRGIAIIKPRSEKEIVTRIRQAEEAGLWAAGVDVDAAGIINMVRAGQPVGPHTPETWERVIKQTELSFVLKGIMTPDEAEIAVDVGAAAIVVSNHGGRVLDHMPGTAEVLPEIADAVQGDVVILVDGGIRSGGDVLKMLALGADAVLVGRPLAIAAVGGGAAAVAGLIDRFTDELRSAMILTGCESLADIDDGILYL